VSKQSFTEGIRQNEASAATKASSCRTRTLTMTCVYHGRTLRRTVFIFSTSGEPFTAGVLDLMETDQHDEV
jgi:hypothetical protein